jgi:lipoprotein-releasing system permease protein
MAKPIARPLLFDIALTHLSGRTRQTALSILGVALGVGFFIAMASMMQGFQGFFVQKVIDVSPHITISDEYRDPARQPAALTYQNAALLIDGIKPKEEVRGIKNAQNIAHALEKIPGLHVSPTLSGQIFFRYGTTDVSGTIVGIHPQQEIHVTKLAQYITQGSLDDLETHANGVIMGDGLAKNLGAGLNDTITAISPAGIVRKMKIVGLFHTGVIAFDDFYVYSLLKKAQILQEKPNIINAIRIRLDDPQAAREQAARIEKRYEYKAESWQEANEGVLSIFIIQDVIMYSTTSAILIVACFGIYNIISTVVNEKARDIAILKSMGFYERDIQMIFLQQGLLVGIIGMICGWGLGYLLIKAMASWEIQVEGIVKMDHLIMAESIWYYAIGGVFCVSAAGLAAYLPARKAAALNPIDILRGAA